MLSQVPSLSETTAKERLAEALRGAEAHCLRRQARELLRQSCGQHEDQLSQQGRRLLYRLALQLMALGEWVEQNRLPQPLLLQRDAG